MQAGSKLFRFLSCGRNEGLERIKGKAVALARRVPYGLFYSPLATVQATLDSQGPAPKLRGGGRRPPTVRRRPLVNKRANC